MSLAPPTTVSLLLRIRDEGNQTAWTEFVELYTPLIRGYARHHGLDHNDAADLVQDVLVRVFRSIRSFEYRAGVARFSGWLLTVTRNQIRQSARDAPRDPVSGRTSILAILHEQAADDADEALWTQTHRVRLFEWAANRVRDSFEPATWEIFERTAIGHQSPSSVAERLGLSVGAVYAARARVMARIRETIARLEET